ncbi:choice-of-anchor D domain-containing protein [Desulfococcaceae bacterium HSG7]|nr:choice-of-anchor D domain-containing protein [Desulfococcaceae bacterium HSG7]
MNFKQFLIIVFLSSVGAVSALADQSLSISGGDFHTLAIKTDSTVWAWGSNSDGQLGIGGTSSEQTTPVHVATDALGQAFESIKAVAAGRYHSIALKTDGTVWTWGSNSNGQLGHGTSGTGQKEMKPEQVSISDVIAIAAGKYHTVVLKNDKTVWAYGSNDDGQLGNSSYVSSITPVQVVTNSSGTSLTNIIAISAGFAHTIALKENGTVWAWGFNQYGQVGDGSNLPGTSVAVAKQVVPLSGVVQIATGQNHSLALEALEDGGTVWAWGWNSSGQLGDGSTTDYSTPQQVSSISNITAIAGGGFHSLALEDDGTVWAWGNNYYGQLGTGDNTQKTYPVISALTTIGTSIAAGDRHSIVLSDNDLWIWGRDYNGQLGDDDNKVDQNRPVQVTGEFGAVTEPAPEINLIQGATIIPDGGIHDIGGTDEGTYSDIVFTIENKGTADLTLTGNNPITFSGPNAGEFNLQVSPDSTVAPGSNTTFTVRFTPTLFGRKFATISIANNDSNENPYDLVVRAFGGSPEASVITSPTPSSRLVSTTVTFIWKDTATKYLLSVGTSSGGNELYFGDQGIGTSVDVSGLPYNGSTVYVRLYSLVNKEWVYNDYIYTAYTIAPKGDINVDGVVNLADVIAGLQICVGVEPATPNRFVLAVDFGESGLWGYDDNQTWLQLNANDPSEIIAADINGDYIDELFATFVGLDGLYIWNGQAWWIQINANLPENINEINDKTPGGIIVWDNKLAVDFDEYGLWIYDGSWEKLKVENPAPGLMTSANVNGIGINELVVFFPSLNAIRTWDGDGWTGIWTNSSTTPNAMVGWNNILVVDFVAANGVWTYSTDTSWNLLTATDPDMIVAGTGGVAIWFLDKGIYKWNGESELDNQIATANVDTTNEGLPTMVWQDSKLVADFGAGGVYSYDTEWFQMNINNPENIAIADINGDLQEEVIATFASGIEYNVNGTENWINITESPAEKLVAMKSSNANQNNYKAADVNGDGRIGLADVIYVLEKEAELR